MNFKKSLSLLVLLSALALVQCETSENKEVKQIKCYQCNSNEDKTCGENYTPVSEHLKPCPGAEKHCRKIIQTGKFFYFIF